MQPQLMQLHHVTKMTSLVSQLAVIHRTLITYYDTEWHPDPDVCQVSFPIKTEPSKDTITKAAAFKMEHYIN